MVYLPDIADKARIIKIDKCRCILCYISGKPTFHAYLKHPDYDAVIGVGSDKKEAIKDARKELRRLAGVI